VPTREIRKQLLSKVHRVVIKLGSYVLTTPSGKLDRKVFTDVVQSVVHLRAQGFGFGLGQLPAEFCFNLLFTSDGVYSSPLDQVKKQ
jgi:hypothetical protein